MSLSSSFSCLSHTWICSSVYVSVSIQNTSSAPSSCVICTASIVAVLAPMPSIQSHTWLCDRSRSLQLRLGDGLVVGDGICIVADEPLVGGVVSPGAPVLPLSISSSLLCPPVCTPLLGSFPSSATMFDLSSLLYFLSTMCDLSYASLSLTQSGQSLSHFLFDSRYLWLMSRLNSTICCR